MYSEVVKRNFDIIPFYTATALEIKLTIFFIFFKEKKINCTQLYLFVCVCVSVCVRVCVFACFVLAISFELPSPDCRPHHAYLIGAQSILKGAAYRSVSLHLCCTCQPPLLSALYQDLQLISSLYPAATSYYISFLI